MDKSIAKERRMKTTTVPGDYYDYILWPEHIKYCSKYIEFLSEQKNKNKNVLIIDGNKEYNVKSVAICILKWINIYKKDLDDDYIYNCLFTNFDSQLNLLKNNFNKK